MSDYGSLLYQQGDYKGARDLFERSLNAFDSSLGPGHPLVARSLNNLAHLLLVTGEVEAALDAAMRAEEIGRAHLYLTARTMAERQALSYASVRASGLDLMLSLAARGLGSESRARVWDGMIRSRALVLDEMAARHRAIAGASQIGRLAQELAAAHQRLANLMVRGPSQESPELYRHLLDEARQDKDKAERSLAEGSVAFQRDLERSRTGLAEITSALPPDTGLVAFARYNQHGTPATQAGQPAAAGSRTEVKQIEPVPSYLAFVLRAGEKQPLVQTLGKAEEIDKLVAEWSREAARGVFDEKRSERQAEAAYRSAGELLRLKVWDPLATYLEGARQIFVIPDGALNLVNLAALPVGEEGYLLEGSVLHYFSAERDLVASGTRPPRRGALLAFGGPDFDETSLFAGLSPSGAGQGAGASARTAAAFRGERSGCDQFHSVRFDPLPGTAREAAAVVALWNEVRGQRYGEAVYLTGTAASEAEFKRRASDHRILHMATHGFFLGSQCPSAVDAVRGVGGLVSTGEKQRLPPIGENPLLLSGLALAGANHRESASAQEDDGILTAEEIAALDLSGVEWAVLSACDTGVGEVRAGEGVFGLRRAFQVAGVGTLIMSLWSVEDESARQWMEALYKARLLKGLGTAEAVREASLEVLHRRRENGQSTHPFYWGGFVAAGDWR